MAWKCAIFAHNKEAPQQIGKNNNPKQSKNWGNENRKTKVWIVCMLMLENQLSDIQRPHHTSQSLNAHSSLVCEVDPHPSITPSQCTITRSSASNMNFPSLYFSLSSYALSYFHPTIFLHCLHLMSRTMCFPVVIFRSIGSDSLMLTT